MGRDGLAVGAYNYTIVVSDSSGNSASDQVNIIVQDTIALVFTSTPADLTYELGSKGNSLSWTATDLQPNTYVIYRNGTLVDSVS